MAERSNAEEDPAMVSFDDSDTWFQWDDEDEASAAVSERQPTSEQECGPESNFLPPLSQQQPQHQGNNSSENLFWWECSQLPPQLHPAVSLGLRRVSSCYLSLQSQQSLLSLDAVEQPPFSSNDDDVISPQDVLLLEDPVQGDDPDQTPQQPLYYHHDVLMNVLAYLDTEALAAFSETGRRCNFEVFYFLQLQLQRALLVEDENENGSHEQKKEKVGCLSRLAAVDPARAKEVVQDFCDSNATLRQPLSHSLLFLRHMLLRNYTGQQQKKESAGLSSSSSPTPALASAAMLIAFVGAASVIGTTAGGSMESASSLLSELSALSEALPNVLKMGFLGGSLMSAARATAPTEERLSELRTRAEHVGRQMMQGHVDSLADMLRLMQEAYNGSCHDESATSASTSGLETVPEDSAATETLSRTFSIVSLLTPNPYEHWPDCMPADNHHIDASTPATSSGGTDADEAPPRPRKVSSGCVGAYLRAIHSAQSRVTALVKERRQARFQALPSAEQQQVGTSFIDACCSDESFSIVKEMVQERGCIDVEGFYVGSDGSETCALHAAAFHGSSETLEFLCRGLDQNNDASRDGGLCNVNMVDSNGWTGIHFAAGANSVEAVRILAANGAELELEASNGYTPLQWAVRLQNHEVAEELRRKLDENADHHHRNHRWIMSRQPLSAIASRFFALIPSH